MKSVIFLKSGGKLVKISDLCVQLIIFPFNFLLDLLDNLRPSSPKPGHVERIVTPNQGSDPDDPVVPTFP